MESHTHQLRKICDLLGGRIEVSSLEWQTGSSFQQVDENSVGGQGSTFRFYVRMTTEPPPLRLATTDARFQGSTRTLPLKFVL
jgi:hypothetical protein